MISSGAVPLHALRGYGPAFTMYRTVHLSNHCNRDSNVIAFWIHSDNIDVDTKNNDRKKYGIYSGNGMQNE